MNKQTEALKKINKRTIYKIVYANTLFDLQNNVNHHLKNGWKLVGGIAFGSKFCGQPMIKRICDEQTN